jgi:tetratricopeptide (TPR) repeat protein
VALAPSDVQAHAALSLVLTFSGDHAATVREVEQALRLDPNLPVSDRIVAGLAFSLHGDHERAIGVLERARTVFPGLDNLHAVLAVAYARAGRLAEARSAAAEARRLGPSLNLELFRIVYGNFRDPQDLTLFLDALRQAGMPAWPFGFTGAGLDRLAGAEVEQLAFGRTWQGRTEKGEPAFLQIGRDGKTAFRTPMQIETGMAFVEGDLLCEQSERVLFGRVRCGPVYRRAAEPGADAPRYTYVNAQKLFHFSAVD